MKQPSRKVYLLPNLLTTGALFSGFYAIIAATNHTFDAAAIAIFVAMVLDGLDGRVARLTNTASEFGAEYDSLADIVSFGLAPALIVYEWAFADQSHSQLLRIGWIVSFIYVACAALRLARFNVDRVDSDKRFFRGLASPAAAAIVVGMVWVMDDVGIQGTKIYLLAVLITLCSGLLMVSRFAYYSFKDLHFKRRVSFIVLIVPVLLIALTSIDPPKFIFLALCGYALSGPALTVFTSVRRRRRRSQVAANVERP